MDDEKAECVEERVKGDIRQVQKWLYRDWDSGGDGEVVSVCKRTYERTSSRARVLRVSC